MQLELLIVGESRAHARARLGLLDWGQRFALQEENQSHEQNLPKVSVWETWFAELPREAEVREARAAHKEYACSE